MKRSLFLISAIFALEVTAYAASEQSAYTPVKDLGNVMYVGDSITHGVAAASYRWPLFKIWVENDIAQQEVGVHARNHSGGVQPGTKYGTQTFLNVHSAISSERAYEIAGRINKSGRLENSNIFDWLGLDKGYSGKRRIDSATQNPASYFMMIGTNDTLSDAGGAGIHSCIAEKERNLLGKGGDMDTIIRAMREANPKARIAVTTIPTWAPGRNNNAAPEDFAAIARYNEKLKEWGRSNKVAVVEVNRGMVDVSDERDFIGVPAMFGRDRLHPSPHGDLIIAGNIAQQLGFAGRTAGLERKAAHEFPQQAAQLARTSKGIIVGKRGELKLIGSFTAEGSDNEAGTVEFRFSKKGFGNGAKGGWDDTKPLSISLSVAGTTGTLSIGESSIRWNGENGRVLYSTDTSKLTARIRMAYVAGNPSQNQLSGYYVWLGDMLIGEACAGSSSGETPGLSVNGDKVRFAQFSYDPEHSWAPTSKGFSNGNPVFESTPAGEQSAALVIDAPQRDGLRLNRGEQGDAEAIICGQASAPSRLWNALCAGALTGSANLTVADNYTGSQAWGPFFAAANGKGIGGDASLTVNSDSFSVQSGKFGSARCSLAGAFRSNVQGCVKFILNKGRYEGNIYGGDISKGQSTQIGSTHIELGAVCVAGDVCAGGLTGSIEGDAVIVLHGTAKVNGKLLSGGNNVKGTRKLVLNKVETMPGAALADFDEIHITNGSKLTLGSLGGAKKLVVDSTSSLTLAPGNYEASVLNSGNIDISAGCTLSLRPEGTDENETGSYTVKGTLKANNVRMSNTIRLEGGKAEGLGEESFRGKLEK